MAATPFEVDLNGPMLRSPELAERLYVIMAYAYYVGDNPIVSDKYFDEVGRYLLQYPEVWTIVDKSTLEAGTFLGDYPSYADTEIKARNTSAPWWHYDRYLHEITELDYL